MQTLVRYSVVNQGGRPVIRAVPVARPSGEPEARAQAEVVRQPVNEHRVQPMLERLLRRRLPDIR